MSDAEKNAQLGEAMFLLQEQKKELAHVEEKLRRVKNAYTSFGASMGRAMLNPVNEKEVILLNPVRDEQGAAAHLMNQHELGALLQEVAAAKRQVEATQAKLKGFGFADI